MLCLVFSYIYAIININGGYYEIYEENGGFILVALIVIVCVGCSALTQFFENDELCKHAESMLNAIVADAFDSAYAVVDEICTKEEFVAVFDEMKKLLADVKHYDLSILSEYQTNSVKAAEGVVSSSTASYKMMTDSHIYS